MLALVAAVSLIALGADDQAVTPATGGATASGPVKISPSDAFRRNFALIKIAMDFEYGGVKFDGHAAQVWAEKKPTMVQTSFYPLVGHWACDGAVEFFRFQSPDERLKRAEKAGFTVREGGARKP